MAVFEVDTGALIAAASAIGAGLAGLGKYLRDMSRETNAVIRDVMRVLGRNEVAVERVEREISGVVELAPAPAPDLSPAERAAGYGKERVSSFPRAQSEPRRGR